MILTSSSFQKGISKSKVEKNNEKKNTKEKREQKVRK